MGSIKDDPDAYEDELPGHSLLLSSYFLSRYPVTNEQYRLFLEADGYNKQEFWSPDGWAWRNGDDERFSLDQIEIKDLEKWKIIEWLDKRPVGNRDRPYWWKHQRWGLPNMPVVGVTWYEATAYCRWLQEQLNTYDYKVRVYENGSITTEISKPGTFEIWLPSEAEWEKAARGSVSLSGQSESTKCEYKWPWGNEWQANFANTKEADIGKPSAVGCFTQGISPYGLLDMAGNVWEWTRSIWSISDVYKSKYSYPYDAMDGREELSGQGLRVIRGGSWAETSVYTRCTFRGRYFPAEWNDVGFRILLSMKP